MKAVPIDGYVYIIGDKFEAQVVAAACLVAKEEWEKGDDYTRKLALMMAQAYVEIGAAALNKNAQSVQN